MPGGRPSEYTEEIIRKAKEYLDNCPDILPSIEGLSLHLGKARCTMYAWAKDDDKEEFSDIFESILTKQAKTLMENGLTGEYNPTITKVILTKHGYTDKQEIEHSGNIDIANRILEARKRASDE